MPSTTPRARPKRRLLVAAAIALALLIALAVALPLLLDVNQYRGLIQQKAQAALGRKVTLGAMSLSMLPLPGIEVRDVAVEGLLKADALDVRVKLLPLLTGSLQVRRLILQHPEITIRRKEDGAWDLPLTGAPEAAAPAQAQSAGTAISLAGLQIKDGVLHLHDASRAGKPLDLEAELDLEAALEMQPSGDLDSSFELSASSDGITVMGRGAAQRLAGKLTADITLDKAQLDLGKMRTLAAALGQRWPIPQGLIEPGTITLGARLQARQDPGRPLSAALSDLVLTGLKLNVVQDARGRWSWEQPDRSSPEPAQPQAAGGPEVTIRNLRISDSSVRVGGAAGKPGGLTLEDMTLVVEEIAPSRPLPFQLSGRFDRGGSLEAGGSLPGTLKLDVSLGRSDLKGTVKIEKTDPVVATLDFASKHTDFGELTQILESLQPPAASAAPARSAPQAGAGGGTGGASIRGQLAIGAGTFGGMAFTDLKSTLVMEKDAVRLDPVAMNLYGGKMKGSVAMDMAARPASYTVSAQADGIQAEPLLTAALDLGGMLAGNMAGQFSITAAGESQDAVLAAARGEGSLRLTQGRVGAVDILGVLSKASGVLGERSLARMSQAMATQGTDFSEMSATVHVSDGKVRSDDLKLVSDDLSLAGAGTLDMQAATMQMAGSINFSPEVSQTMVDEGSRAAEYFWDSRSGQVSLPLTLAGPVTAPLPGIDWQKAGSKLARRKAEEALSDKLEKAGLGGLLKKGVSPQRSAPPPADPVDPAALDAVLEGHEFTGSILARDLKLRGHIRGVGISKAQVTVRDGAGRVVHEESLHDRIKKFYTAHDAAAPGAINFRITVEGRDLAGTGTGALEVLVTVTDESGRTVEKRFEVER